MSVHQKNYANSNFVDWRYEQYMKKVSSVELLPTSSTINRHLERSYLVVNTRVNLLKEKKLLNPLNYCWRKAPEGLLPKKDIYIYGHNILKLLDVWPNFSFITSEAKINY